MHSSFGSLHRRLSVPFAAASLSLCLILPPTPSAPARLEQARVSQIVREVNLLPDQAAPRPAKVSDEVRDGTAIRTGAESRAELVFTDETLARLGANTIFSFKEGTRNLDLGGGAMLLRVPKGAGGAQIKTAGISAAITGTTVLLEYHPDAYCKFIVLEGTGRIFRNNRVGESVLVHAGQMLIVNPKGTGLPEPVEVDLERLMKTSLLITGFPPLASSDLIARAIGAQTEQKNEGDLVNTNLVIFGGGTGVSLLDPTRTALLDQANANPLRPGHSPTPSPTETPAPTETPTPTSSPTPTMSPTPSPTETPTPTITPTPTVSPTPTSTPTPTVSPSPSKFGTPPVISSLVPYLIGSDTTINTDPTITTNGVTDFGKIYRDSELDGAASQWFFGSTSDFDNMIGFDQGIFVGDRAPIAAFKFASLSLVGNPTLVIPEGAPNNLALVSVGDMTSGASAVVFNLPNLNFLFLGTEDGSITLSSNLTFENIPTLAAYARGAGSVLTFDAAVTGSAIVGLLSEGSILATDSLTIEEASGATAPNGFIVSLLAGETIEIGQDLTLSISNTDTMTMALTVVTSLGDISVNGENGVSLAINNAGAQIDGQAFLGMSAGGNLTTSLLNLLLDNGSGGTINTAAGISCSASGTLTTTSDAILILNNGDPGGTIVGTATLNLSGTAISIGGVLVAVVANNDGGTIEGFANVFVNATGALDVTADVDAVIWCVDYVRVHRLLPARLRRILTRNEAQVFTPELLGEATQILGQVISAHLTRRAFATPSVADWVPLV